MADETHCTAFQGSVRIASGPLAQVAAKIKAVVDAGEPSIILILDDLTSEPIEVDFRGSVEDVVKRLATHPGGVAVQVDQPAGGPGRPKLGVLAREVTLLPRHWEWLARQPGGASVALRKLVEEARRTNGGKDRLREAQASTYRFISALAGNEAGFVEAARALFAGNAAGFNKAIGAWPPDIRAHAMKLAAAALPERAVRG